MIQKKGKVMRTRMLAGIVFAVVVFLCQGITSAHEMRSVHLEDGGGNFVLIDGGRVPVDALVGAFGQEGFVVKSEGPKEVMCTIDALALLLVTGVPKRGIAVTCGRGTDMNVGGDDPDYTYKVTNHVARFLKYIRSPFVEDLSKSNYEEKWVYLGRSDQTKKINSCVHISRKDWGNLRLTGYNKESQEKYAALAALLKEEGYKDRRMMPTLCHGIIFDLACFVQMDDADELQKHTSPSTHVQCSRNDDRANITELLTLNNDIRGEGYVSSIFQAIQVGIESLTR